MSKRQKTNERKKYLQSEIKGGKRNNGTDMKQLEEIL